MKRDYPNLLVLITCCTFVLNLITIPFAFASTSPDCITHTFSTSISDPNHDVEELPEGFIMTISPSLELVHNPWIGHQPVGLRFEGIALPRNVEIISAYLQFTTNQTNIETCELYIEGELAIDPSPFFSQLFDLTQRQKTNTRIDWSPAAWTILGEASTAQRTPDLSPILNEIIAQENWVSENPITFFLNGIGSRPASAFDHNPDQAPRLIIEINIPKEDTPYQGIVINELMAANGIYPDEFAETDDWVEIYNGSNDTISLGNLYLSDDEDQLDKWMIPTAKKLAPGALVTIWLDNHPNQGALHGPFKLNKEGEYLALTQKINGQFNILDEIEFPSLALNVSYGRVTDGQNDWVRFIKPSRGNSNDFNKLLANLNVEFSIPGGVYEDSLHFSLSTNHPNASIYYTLDGSSPTRSSLLYDAPLLLDSSRLISARAFTPGHSGYRAVNEFYIIGESHQLPIISIQTEPENLWDDQKGIYTVGSNGIIGHCKIDPFNWNQDWERPAQVAFFEEDGSKAFQVNAGIKIAGGCSRQQKMKSLNVFCRNDEYGNKQINYKIFPDLDISHV